MTRVNTLRVVFGHPKLTEALLRCFFDENRQRENPVKRLWLENVRIIEGTEMVLDRHKYGLPLRLDFNGVEMVRLRRLPMATMDIPQEERATNPSIFVYSRGETGRELQNGLGGNYLTSTSPLNREVVRGHEQLEHALDNIDHSNEQSPLEALMGRAIRFDDAIYKALSLEVKFPAEVVAAMVPSPYWRSILAYRDQWDGPATELSAEGSRIFRQIFRTDQPTAAYCAGSMFSSMATTLTSLNIDWVITPPNPQRLKRADYEHWIKWYADLFSMRFPHLKAFQYRNAVAQQTLLPEGLFLFDYSTIFTGNDFERHWVPGMYPSPPFEIDLKPLEFFEAHTNLQCLAWPMDQFFSHTRRPDIFARVRSVIDRLGQTLIDLRVDAFYTGFAEPHSADDEVLRNPASYSRAEATVSRRRFVKEFAAKMHILKSIKIEGGMPLDERRETISALYRCPIEKLVFIGVASVIGNTWGANGGRYRDLSLTPDADGLESEDENAIQSLGGRKPEPAKTAFEPSYGWRGSPPMLHTIVSQHGSTLRELKFCGYKGAVNLYDPSPITHPMLAALKHCHALESLIMSFWLSTMFKDEFRDDEVMSYWLDRRDSSTTSLVSLSDEPELGSWAYELKTKFAPRALAWGIVRFLGQYLSETAKRRKGGVRVRASFCVGDWGGIFDIDVQIGKGSLGSDVCLGFEGPREELEDRRRREKLDSRRWF
jgi:hypothetical protein